MVSVSFASPLLCHGHDQDADIEVQMLRKIPAFARPSEQLSPLCRPRYRFPGGLPGRQSQSRTDLPLQQLQKIFSEKPTKNNMQDPEPQSPLRRPHPKFRSPRTLCLFLTPRQSAFSYFFRVYYAFYKI